MRRPETGTKAREDEDECSIGREPDRRRGSGIDPQEVEAQVRAIGARARAASKILALAKTESKRNALRAAATAIRAREGEMTAANEKRP